jgi:hypothetical protein
MNERDYAVARLLIVADVWRRRATAARAARERGAAELDAVLRGAS